MVFEHTTALTKDMVPDTDAGFDEHIVFDNNVVFERAVSDTNISFGNSCSRLDYTIRHNYSKQLKCWGYFDTSFGHVRC